MTDQNNLARDYSAEVSDDDPLAELARIVSGQPARPAASFKPRSYAEIAREKTAQLQEMARRQAEELRHSQSSTQRHSSIEDALMRELGLAGEREAARGGQERVPQEASFSGAHEDFGRVMEDALAFEPAPQSRGHEPAPLSLEDQLMAELGFADDASSAPHSVSPEPSEADPFADIWGASDAPSDQQRGREAQAPQQYDAARAFDGHDDGGRGEGDRPRDKYSEGLRDWRVEADDQDAVYDSREAYAADQHDEEAAQGEVGGEIALEQFAGDLQSAFAPNSDPYDADLSDLEAAVSTGRQEAEDGAFLEDELFRDLAAGASHAPAGRSASRSSQPRPDPLYGAPGDFVAGIDDVDAAQAEQDAAADEPFGFDAVDFGAALEAEVLHLQTDRASATAEAPRAVAHPASPRQASPRAIEDRFAAAFAEELQLGLEPEEQNLRERDQGDRTNGWRQGETHDARASFAATAAPRESAADPAGHEYYESGDDHYDYGEEVDPGYDDEETVDYVGRPRRRGFALAAGALGLAMLLGSAALGFGYLFGGAGGEGAPAVVKADAGPVKIKPEDPGGTRIHNQDQAVYDRVAGSTAADSGQDRLVSTSEEPVDVAALGSDEAVDDGPAGDAGDVFAPSPVDVEPLPEAADAAEPEGKFEERLTPGAERPATETAALFAPRRVKTVAVKPDGTLLGQPELLPSVPALAGAPDPAPAAGPSAVATTSENAFVPAIDADDLAGAALLPLDGLGRTSALPEQRPLADVDVARPEPAADAAPATRSLAAEPAGEPLEVAALPATTAPASSAPWAVQLASQRSAEDAQSTFQSLKRKFPSILDGKPLAVQRADVEGKGTFFRVRVPAQTREEANALCDQLKSAGGSCFVTR